MQVGKKSSCFVKFSYPGLGGSAGQVRRSYQKILGVSTTFSLSQVMKSKAWS